MDETARIEFVSRMENDVLVMTVNGALTAGAECRRFRQEMDRLLDAGTRKLLLNLGGVAYMDSTGVGTLLAVKTTAINRGLNLKVCCVPSFIYRLLSQLHLVNILDVHGQEPDGIASFRP